VDTGPELEGMPFGNIGELDTLYDQAQAGAKAATALDVIRIKLTTRRNGIYHKFLNETDPVKLPRFQAELRAIEILANSLLIDEKAGDIAWETIMASRPGGVADTTEAVPTLMPERPRKGRRRRASATISQ
jgi:hypothetical protein